MAAEVTPIRPLAVQQAASDAATKDREATADLVLGMAVRDAVDLIRDNRPGYARFRLTRALMSADRILGGGGRP